MNTSPAFCSADGGPPRRYRFALQDAGASGGLGAGEGPQRPPGYATSFSSPATRSRGTSSSLVSDGTSFPMLP